MSSKGHKISKGRCCREAKQTFNNLPDGLAHSHKEPTIKDFEG